MRPALVQWLLTGLLLTLSLSVRAEPTGLGVGFSDLYRIDLASGQASRLGAIGFNDVEGLAIAPDGALFGVADLSAGTGSAVSDLLVRIDTSTGRGSLVGVLPGLAGQGPDGNLDYGLAFTADGRLWMSSETTAQLWEVSPTSATVRRVGTLGAAISGLAARGDQLYGVSAGSSPGLYRIDRDSAGTTLIGLLSAGVVVDDVGLDFDAAGVLWASLDPEPAAEGLSKLVSIDLATGRANVISTAQANVGIEGLAIAPPAPANPGGGVIPGAVQPIPAVSSWSLALLLVLVAGVALLRFR